jgi:mannose-6-phosphate isomerase-like protein (cupin superfamily)
MSRWQIQRVGATPTHLAPDGSQIFELSRTGLASLARCVLPAGAVTRAVRHRTVEELWYVVGGRGQVWRADDGGDEIVDVEAGTSLSIPLGVAFQFRAGADDPLELILTTIPPWPGPDEAVVVEGRWEARVG